MQRLRQQFDYISLLSSQISALLKEENFEQANTLLEQRLDKLKSLHRNFESLNVSDEFKREYQDFLLSIQQSDQKEQFSLNNQREILQNKTVKQNKTKQALSTYKNVKLGL